MSDNKQELHNIINFIETTTIHTNIYFYDHIYNLLNTNFNINTQNENGDTLLHALIINNNYDKDSILELIDTYNFDLNLKNNKNFTIIDYLYDDIYFNKNLIIELLNRGYKPSFNNIQSWSKEFMFYIKDFILLGFNHDLHDNNGNTILHYIISTDRIILPETKLKFFKELVEHKQDYYILNNKNESPVDLARKYNYKDIINYITNYEYSKIKNSIIINFNLDEYLIKNLVTFLI